MDGTLLNSNHEVSDRFFSIFQKLKERGVIFVAASGRQYHSMAHKLAPIKEDIIFIAENGALVRRKEQELSVTPIASGLKGKLLDIVEDIEDAYAMLCGKYKSYFDGRSLQFLEELKEYYSCYEVVDDFSKVDDEIVKIAVYHGTSAEDFIYPRMQQLEKEVKVKVSGQHWVDLNDYKAHKGNALKKVMGDLGVSEEELLVFGDYNNDLEMLSLAKHSFAMANAHPNVKKVANFETFSNDAFGVETILEKLL